MAPKRYLEKEWEENEEESGREAKLLRIMRSFWREEVLPEFENTTRRLLREEIQNAPGLYQQSVPRPLSQIEPHVPSCYQLHFKNAPSMTLYTDNKFSVEIVIINGTTKKRIEAGSLSVIKIEVVVLNGDFGCEDQEDWVKTNFDSNILRERDGKSALLNGNRPLTLRAGIGTICDIAFTDNSRWVRSGKFRLGARALKDSCANGRIREAISDAFVVKDNRGKATEKHHPPLLDDDVWCLVKIRKDGVYHNRLVDDKVKTVQDLLRFSVTNPDKLQEMFPQKKALEAILCHARKCDLGVKCYSYTIKEWNVVIVFNSILEVVGASFDGLDYQPVDRLTASQKTLLIKLKMLAYENKNDMVEFDGSPIHCPLKSRQRTDIASFPESGPSAPLIPAYMSVHEDFQAVPNNLDPKYLLLDEANQTKSSFFQQETCPIENSHSSPFHSYDDEATSHLKALHSNSSVEFNMTDQRQKGHTYYATSLTGSTSSPLDIYQFPSIGKGILQDSTNLDPLHTEPLQDEEQTLSSGHELFSFQPAYSCPIDSHQISKNFDGEVSSHQIDQHGRAQIARSRWAILRARSRKCLAAKRSRVNWLKLKAASRLGISIHKSYMERLMTDMLDGFR